MATETPTGSALKAWLLERVEMVPWSGCWIWMGRTEGDGYGSVYLGREGRKRRYRSAHRLMYEAEFGEIPEGMLVCHHCDNPPCINLDHLFLGTNGDNARDAARKGRARNGVYRGERNGNAKLTSAQVEEIRSRYAEGGVSQESLSEEYGVAQIQVSRIIRNESWSHHEEDGDG